VVGNKKNLAWDTVLIEQDEQEQFGYYDEERIADLYKHVQQQHNNEKKVLDRAKKDRVAADDYLMTPRTMRLVKKSITTSQESAMTIAEKINASNHNLFVGLDSPRCNNSSGSSIIGGEDDANDSSDHFNRDSIGGNSDGSQRGAIRRLSV